MAKAPVRCLNSSSDAFILPVHSFVESFTANDNLAPVKFLLGGRAECGIIPEVVRNCEQLSWDTEYVRAKKIQFLRVSNILHRFMP